MPVIRGFGTTRSYSESAADDAKINRTVRGIGKKIDIIDRKMDSLYKDIYVSRIDNQKNIDSTLDRLDNAIDNIASSEISVSNMSELVRRIGSDSGSSTKELMTSVEELFSDQNLIQSLFANENVHQYIAGQNRQYDMICKYLPKVLDALEIKRDNVLCSDNFSKNFINPKSVKAGKEESAKFAVNAKNIEKIYEFSEFVEKGYMNISKYGEEFVYIIPYSTAFSRLITRSNQNKNNAHVGQFSYYEGCRVETVLSEGYYDSDEFKKFVATSNIASKPSVTESTSFKGKDIRITFNDSGIVRAPIHEMAYIDNIMLEEYCNSLGDSYMSQLLMEAKQTYEGNLSKQMEELDKKNDKLSAAAAADGLIIPDNLDRDPTKIDKNINGAVVERLPRENVIPIYIGKKRCIGYYYIEFKEDPNACGYCGGHHMNPMVGNSSVFAYEMSEDQQELAVRYIASKIAQHIDTHFINSNKDLKEDIYAILQYNEKFDISRSNDIAVTFLPADDVIHCYFDIDEETHRGISDLQKSVVPAMLYILLYLTDIIGKITRSNDKRVYYVKQSVETNVAKTMMNVVQQIKKGNMGMRQIESMNNILNIVGKYNDYIIPVGQSGEPPIQFEVMQGQNIETPTDIMDKMEEAAVNATGTPIEMVNSTYQTDFATRFTMSNTRFLKSIYTRQRKVEKYASKMYTKIYNYEYKETNSLIQLILPPPTYLTVTNNQQLIDNISQLADKIIELEMSNEDDELKNIFKKLYVRAFLSTYIDFDQVERIRELAQIELQTSKNPATEDGEASGDADFGEYM